jgi:hypothetical protein
MPKLELEVFLRQTPLMRTAISDVSLILNGTGLSAGSAAVTSFGNIVKYGNKNGDR